MKQLFYFLVLVITVSSCGSSCNKGKDKYIEVEFEFVIPLSINPSSDSLNVGEELMLTANFPDSLFDFLSQKKYYLPNFNLKTVAVIRKLVDPNQSITEQQSAVNKFQINNTIGGLTNLSSTFADVNYSYGNNLYKLTTKLKMLEPGIYAINFYHDPGTSGSSELPQYLAPSEPGIKKFPLMRRTRYIFNNGNTHFTIYKQHCKPADPNEATNWVESKATYTFVIK